MRSSRRELSVVASDVVVGANIPERSWAARWQASWDSLEQRYVPDRERRLQVLIDLVVGLGLDSPLVIDLASGPGSVAVRLLDRLPAARVVAVDVDPVLLAIATATFASDDRVRVVRADLTTRWWASALPVDRFDAVLTATALHWLPEPAVRALYHDLAGLIRLGGIFGHSELMPLSGAPGISGLLDVVEHPRRQPRRDEEPTWDSWWDDVASDEILRVPAQERRELFGGEHYPREEFSPQAEWHIAALVDAGFAEAAVVWRSGAGAVVAAQR